MSTLAAYVSWAPILNYANKDRSQGHCQPEASIGAASQKSLLVMLEKKKMSLKTNLDFGSTVVTDEDVVCSQVDRDQFKVFVKEQGESDLGKIIRLIDYIMAKEIYRLSQVCDLISTKAQSLTIP